MAKSLRPGHCFLLTLFLATAIPLVAQQPIEHHPSSPLASGRGATDVRAPALHGPSARGAQRFAPDRVLIRFRPAATKEQRQQLRAATGASKVKEFRIVQGLELLRLAAGMRLADALRQYRRSPNVLYAEPDYKVSILRSPDDPGFSSQWALHNTGQNGGTPGADFHAPEAWELTTGSADMVVGIIDTGVDYTHPDLAANVWSNSADCNANGTDDDGDGYVDDCHGIDVINADSDPMDDAGHGTHVAGIIGAVGNNSLGVVGVNWQVRMAACKFLDSSGSGHVSGAISCMEYFQQLRAAGVSLVATNNSWGGGGYSQAMYDAIDAHRQAGILFVAAAGNSAMDNDIWNFYPANYGLPNVISVAATDHSDLRADFSDFGQHTVHLGAPGVDIYNTLWPGNPWYPGQSYGEISGTSMAAPHVTGVAALLKAQDATRDWRAIKNLILAGGDTISSLAGTITGKRLNAHGAMTCVNSELLRGLRPRRAVITSVPGGPVEFQVLHIDCASPAGDVTLTVDPGGSVLTLKDDGVAPDLQAGDGIYSGQWTPPAVGDYTVTFPGDDKVSLTVLQAYSFSPAPYAYRDFAGTDLGLDTYYLDREYAWLDSPFPIRFGGGTFSRLAVNVNGTISFTEPFPDFDWAPLPASSASTLVAPSWTLLWAWQGSGDWHKVYWGALGTEPNRELVIEWRGLTGYCDIMPTITFQTVFFENSSDVLFNYKDMTFGVDYWGNDCTADSYGAAASSGIQVSPKVATQYSYAEPLLQDETAVLWTLGTPAPTLNDISPFTAAVGEPGFDLHVSGRSFLPSSVVQWNGSVRETSFLDSTHLRAAIPATDLNAAGEVPITVFTPSGGTSSPGTLTVFDAYPVPAIAAIDPGEFWAGYPGTWIHVTGSDFLSKSMLHLDGSSRQTRVANATSLLAFLTQTDLAQPVDHKVTVVNPAPGGGASTESSLPVKSPPVPVLGGVTPAETGGGSDTTFILSGSGFIYRSVARMDGAQIWTQFLDSGHVSAWVPETTALGAHQITVYTPPPGGGESNPLTVKVTGFLLAVSPESATAKPGQTATFTVTVTPDGGGFDKKVTFGCSGLPCSFDPSNGTPNSSPLTATLTVTAPPALNAGALQRPSAPHFGWSAVPLLFGMLLLSGKRRRGTLLLLAFLGSLALYSCGGGATEQSVAPKPPSSTTYSIIVSATSGTLTKSANLSLTVQP